MIFRSSNEIFKRRAESQAVIERTFPYSVYKRVAWEDRRADLYEWCEEHTGSGDAMSVDDSTDQWIVDTSGLWCHFYTSFWFKNERDAFAFKMRWA